MDWGCWCLHRDADRAQAASSVYPKEPHTRPFCVCHDMSKVGNRWFLKHLASVSYKQVLSECGLEMGHCIHTTALGAEGTEDGPASRGYV